MYLQITRIKRKVYSEDNYNNIIKQIRLCLDDWTPVKFIKQTDEILEKFKEIKIEVAFNDVKEYLTEKDMNKIFDVYQKEKSLFDNTN